MSVLPANYRKLLAFVMVALAALLLSRPAAARQAPTPGLGQGHARALNGQAMPADQSADPMVVLQSGLSEDDFTQMTVLLGSATDPQSCATDLAAALQTAHVSASASDDCADMLQDAVDLLAPYVACPGGDADQCGEPQTIVFDAGPDDGTRAAPTPPLNVNLNGDTATTLTFRWVPPYAGAPQSYNL